MRKYHHVGLFLKLEYGPGVMVPHFHHAEIKVPNSLPQKGTKKLLVLTEMKMNTFFLLGEKGWAGEGGGEGELNYEKISIIIKSRAVFLTLIYCFFKKINNIFILCHLAVYS